MVALSASGAAVAVPAFQLPLGMPVVIEGTEFQVERRLQDGRWQFLSVEEGTPRFLSDAQLAELMQGGSFYVEKERGLRAFAPAPISPLLIGPEAHAANQRKHDYVMACVRAPGGLKRSRLALLGIIQEVASARGETPPGFTTVLNWIDEYERHGEYFGTAAYSDRHDLKGARGPRSAAFQDQAVALGLDAYLQLGKKRVAYDLVCEAVRKFDEEQGRFLDKGALGPKYVDDHGRLKPPSLRTFERRCSDLNRFTQDWALKGPAYAKQKNRTFQRTGLPERPYAEIEVDHTRLDILIMDDERGLVLGRPDLIIFRDRATGMIAGYGLGFEEPSFASFLQGLRHATYPKDLLRYPAIKNGWPCYGRFENLFVDNALHFIGDNIIAAGRELGFNLVRFQPRQPWLKGALERFFGSLGTGLVHQLVGTTLHNVMARRDHEFLGEANLTLDEFEALLNFLICEIYHAEPRRGLGVIRGVGDAPLAVWADKAKSFKTPLLPHPDVFMSLVGDRDRRTIQNDGITWDYITYESPELWALRSHPRHRRPAEGGSTKYEITRDPFDLGQISVRNPYDNTIIVVPATTAHRSYATGLGLHQHRVIISNAKSRVGERVDFQALEEARAILAKVVASIRGHPGRRKIERALGRYLNVEQTRRYRTEIVTEAASTPVSDLLQWGDLEVATPPPSAAAPASVRVHQPPPAICPDEDDLDLLRQRKNWSSYND